jgi:ABC-type multidrug transport system ATPase subunit
MLIDRRRISGSAIRFCSRDEVIRVDAIAVTGLRDGYDRTPVLDGVGFDVPTVSTTAILGASGCGKTTLLRLIAGFLRPESGRISVGDRVLSDERTFVPSHLRAVGYVRQDWGLFPHRRGGQHQLRAAARPSPARRASAGALERLCCLV